MSVKKREPLKQKTTSDPLVEGILIGGFVIAVMIGVYGLVRLFKR